jgi:predicted SprT family Zn-dependent metalloprotease
MPIKLKSKYDPNKDSYYIKRIQSMADNAIDKLLRQKLKNKNYDYIIELMQLKVNGIKITINKKLQSTIAMAYVKYNKNKICKACIIINPVMFEYSIKFRKEIITHELAHCWDFYIREDSNHDKLWKSLHKEFNGTATRLIDMALYE